MCHVSGNLAREDSEIGHAGEDRAVASGGHPRCGLVLRDRRGEVHPLVHAMEAAMVGASGNNGVRWRSEQELVGFERARGDRMVY